MSYLIESINNVCIDGGWINRSMNYGLVYRWCVMDGWSDDGWIYDGQMDG